MLRRRRRKTRRRKTRRRKTRRRKTRRKRRVWKRADAMMRTCAGRWRVGGRSWACDLMMVLDDASM
eukprot:1425417-Rhodomonas_salina.1